MLRNLLARSDQLAALVAILALAIFFAGRHLAPAAAKAESVDDAVPLTDLILAVKRQLRAADERRLNAGEAALFRIMSVDLEIYYVISTKSTLGGGANVNLIAVNATDERRREQSQKITVHLDLLQDSTIHAGEVPHPEAAPLRPPLQPQ